jgi:aspartate/tyrosine/aromatic aminotransferase
MSVDAVALTTNRVQFVVGSGGKPTGVLLDMPTWEHIVESLEDAEDMAVVREALAGLKAVGGDRAKAGFRPWAEVRAELLANDDSEE